MAKKITKTNFKYDDISEILDSVIKRAVQKKLKGGLLYISLDNISTIISSQNVEISENIINDLSKKLLEYIGKKNKIYRVDKDHLNIILYDYTPKQLEKRCEEIGVFIQKYHYDLDELNISMVATLGSVDFPGTSDNNIDAINKAYVALNDAREAALHYMPYKDKQKHKEESTTQLTLANYIQEAFLKKRLCVVFQPLVKAANKKTTSYECLLRIIEDDGSLSSVGPFIPVAEKMGFIDIIDGYVLQLVVNELKKYKSLKLAMNVSNASINNSHWLKMAKKLLKDKKIAKRLTIEIIETSEQHNIKIVQNFIKEIKNLGCKIALDDFGTGYTSFTQLQLLDIDIIKIDGSFIKNILTNKKDEFFVKTMIEFSKTFNIKTVAEFIDSESIAKKLTNMGVDFLQGYLYSPPCKIHHLTNNKPNKN